MDSNRPNVDRRRFLRHSFGAGLSGVLLMVGLSDRAEEKEAHPPEPSRTISDASEQLAG
jgi:hypothetical protein